MKQINYSKKELGAMNTRERSSMFACGEVIGSRDAVKSFGDRMLTHTPARFADLNMKSCRADIKCPALNSVKKAGAL